MAENKISTPTNRINSVIGAGTTFEGKVLVAGTLRIDGTVKGSVAPSGTQPVTLVLGEHGSIEGTVQATHAIINGRVVGQIFATDSIELQRKCSIDGDIHYGRLEMHPGAVANGRLLRGAAMPRQEEQVEPKFAAGH